MAYSIEVDHPVVPTRTDARDDRFDPDVRRTREERIFYAFAQSCNFWPVGGFQVHGLGAMMDVLSDRRTSGGRRS